MNNHLPKITLICPAYNHEKYVGYFIESVLAQTEQDFELIICDDCSSDNTVAEIKKFSDPRIKLIQHSYNKGVNFALTETLELVRSELVCFSASDDMLYENYFEEVLKKFSTEDIVACYASIQIIDGKNTAVTNEVFRPGCSLSRFEILNKSFFYHNQLASPGIAMKKSVISKFLPFVYGLLHCLDWRMHHNLLLSGNIGFLENVVYKYRRHAENTSNQSFLSIKREKLEYDALMDSFLDIKDVELLKKIFPAEYGQFGEPVEETIPYFLGRLAMLSPIPEKQAWGYRLLINYISQGNNFELLHNLYGVEFKTFMELAADYISYEEQLLKLRKKIKKQRRKYRSLLFGIILFFCLMILFLNCI